MDIKRENDFFYVNEIYDQYSLKYKGHKWHDTNKVPLVWLDLTPVNQTTRSWVVVSKYEEIEEARKKYAFVLYEPEFAVDQKALYFNGLMLELHQYYRSIDMDRYKKYPPFNYPPYDNMEEVW